MTPLEQIREKLLIDEDLTGNVEGLRMMTKVSHLYHSKGMVQTDIAQKLGLSQARVSRLLSTAEEKGIVRRIVVAPLGLFSEIERRVEEKFGLDHVHIVDSAGENEEELMDSLGMALASVFHLMPIEGKTIGFTSWSRSLRSFVYSLSPFPRVGASKIIEMLGGVGQPSLQHIATSATESFGKLTNAETIFLRVPGVVSSVLMRQALLESDSHARQALMEFEALDIALVGIGTADASAHINQESNFFSTEQFEQAQAAGAVAEINLRFIDQQGRPVNTNLDDLVLGVSLDQLRKVKLKIGVSGGPSKLNATLAVANGKWVDVLVTDSDTANFLLEN